MMDTAKIIYDYLSGVSILPKQSESFWREAGIILLSPSEDEPQQTFGQDLVVRHPDHINIALSMSVVVMLLSDPVFGYDHLSKFEILSKLILNLPRLNPVDEIFRRLLRMYLEKINGSLYFAYGSNMYLEQMTARCPKSKLIGSGILKNYRFIINEQGHANILENADSIVEGALYLVTDDCLHSLDEYEGVSEGVYERAKIEVEKFGLVYCYLGSFTKESPISRFEYFQKILAGAYSLSVSPKYFEKLLEYGFKNTGIK